MLTKLFHPIKALRASRDAEIALRIEMEDKLRRAQAQLDALRDERDSAREEAIFAHRAIADWMAELKFGHPIFGTRSVVPALAATNENDLNAAFNHKPRARQIVQQQTQNFFDEYDRQMAEAAAQAESNAAE